MERGWNGLGGPQTASQTDVTANGGVASAGLHAVAREPGIGCGKLCGAC